MSKIKMIGEKFDEIAAHYSTFAYLAQEMGEQLLQRLSFAKINPQTILDLGCADGRHLASLQARYPEALVMGCDLSWQMLQQSTNDKRIQANAWQLPYPDNSLDLVFANLVFCFCEDLLQAFLEIRRVLKPNGLLCFSMLGPDTAKELGRQHFFDMHDIGDALVQAKLIDPVMEVDHSELHYDTAEKCWQELENSGLDLLIEQNNESNIMHAELVYGHAWGALDNGLFSMDAQGEVRIPIAKIKRLRTHQ